MKDNQQVGYTVEGDIITFNVKGHNPLTLDVTKIHADNQRRAMIAGLARVRIVDMAAVDRADRKTGSVRTLEEMLAIKHARMARGIEHLESGSPFWRVGGRDKVEIVTDHTLTVRAIAQLKGMDFEATNGLVNLWATQNNVSRGVLLDTFAARPDVAELVRGFRAESVKDIDTDAMLGQLTGE